MATPSTTAWSGERITASYHLTGPEAEARQKAADICLEQTVELPDDLITREAIRTHILGRIEQFEPVGDGRFAAQISYAVESSDLTLPQLLNLLFGNISLKPGIRLERFDLPPTLLAAFNGPRFGRDGLRTHLGIPERPLLCTALKPMGLSAAEMAELAYQFALGGIDMIKDDHGLADQPFCPFEERVARCSEAVRRANERTGLNCIYMPNVTAAAGQVEARARFARQAGAGGLLFVPGLTGLDRMRRLADDEAIALPIMSHPAFQGSFVTNPDAGISHYALFGQICRLAGADATIFPNYGGRFAFTREECLALVEGSRVGMGQIKPIFPTPAGGMKLANVPEMCACYGGDVIFLIGGGLQKHGPSLVENCRHFRRLVAEQWQREIDFIQED